MTKKEKDQSREVIHRYFRAQIRKIDSEKFTVDALVSDGTCDRHGTVIKPEAWKKDLKYYKDHPVLLASHDHFNLLSVIGESLKVWVTDEGLMQRFKYYVGEGNQQADWAWNLAEKGMAMYSVGFIAYEWEDPKYDEKKKVDPVKDPWRVYTRAELAETSQVTVGSNRNALQRALDGVYKETMLTEIGEKTNPDLVMLSELATEILEAIKKGELSESEADKHTCECLDCGHTVETEKHCDKLKCPECGGDMRRKERPGPGKKTDEEDPESSSPQGGDDEEAGKAVPPDPAPSPPAETEEGRGEPPDLAKNYEEELGAMSEEDTERPYPNEHACRLRDPGDFKKDSFKRTKRKHDGKEYSVIMGKLKGEDTMTEQAYRYDKKAWTEKEAKGHCDDHDGTFEAAEKGADMTIEFKVSDLKEFQETVNRLFKWLEKLNEKLELFTPDELKALLGGQGAEEGGDKAHTPPESGDPTDKILSKGTDEDKGRSSGLGAICAEAEKVAKRLKGES